MIPKQFSELPVGSIVRSQFTDGNVDYVGFWILITEPYKFLNDSTVRYRDLMFVAGSDDMYKPGDVFAAVDDNCKFVECTLDLYDP